MGGVVVGQFCSTFALAIGRGYLTCQVLVAVRGVQDVEGVTVRYLPTPLPAGSPGGLLRFLRAAPAGWRRWTDARRRFAPDVLHVHCFGPNGVAALALHRRLRTPLIVTSHGETVADDNRVFERSTVLRVALRRALAAASSVTAPSQFVLDNLRRNFGLREGTAGLLAASFFIDRDVRRMPRRVRQPALLMLAGLDRIVDNARTLAYFQSLASPDRRIIEYPEAHHTLEFEPDPSRYARDLTHWLDAACRSGGRC